MVNALRLYKENRILLLVLCIVTLSIPILYYVPPESYDLYRHYEMYEFYQQTKDADVLKNYFGLSYLVKLLVMIGLPAESMTFVCSVLFFFTMFKFNAFIQNTAGQRSELSVSLRSAIVWFVPFLIFNYLALMSGLRFSIATSFFVLAVLADYCENKKTSVAYHILAISFHFSLLGLIIAYYFSKRINIKTKTVKLFLFILGLIFSQIVGGFESYILDIVGMLQLTGDWAYKANVYLFGEWGTQANEALNTSGLFVVYLLKAMTYTCFFVFLLTDGSVKIYHNNEFISLCVILLAFVSAFYTLSDRFESLVICFLFLPIGIKLMNTKKLSYYEWLVLLLILLRGFFQLLNYREEYLNLILSFLI